MTMDDLQTIVIASQQEALRKWFEKVCKSMEEVELKKYISRKISDSEFVEEGPLEVPEILKSGLQASWLSKFFVKPDHIVIESQEPEIIQFQDKVEVDLQEQKMTTEAIIAQLMEVMKEHK